VLHVVFIIHIKTNKQDHYTELNTSLTENEKWRFKWKYII